MRLGSISALSLAAALLAACTGPTHDPTTLKAIEAESRALMTTQGNTVRGRVPKSQWPPAIANLGPEWVTVDSDGVDIAMKPYFDGGWGYFVPLNEREPPEPEGRFSKLSEGVYWYRPS